MAREEHDREDLLREATALVERIELRLDGCDDPITAGYRRDGGLSLFFDQDPVWHFNARGELRRGYRGGKLLKAERGRLVEMTRARSESAVELRSRLLGDAEHEYVLSEITAGIAAVVDVIAAGCFTIVGQVPPEVDLVGRLQASLAALSDGFTVAQSPRV